MLGSCSLCRSVCVLLCVMSAFLADATTNRGLQTSVNKKRVCEDTRIVFSDVDGTLVHYPKRISQDDAQILSLPPSSTGMRAVISQETIRKCRDIRKRGRKLVLVSGMRTTTLLNRLPYLPKADAYCSEAGGRIFYPTADDVNSALQIKPLSFDGATYEDLQSFGLVEDLQWRKVMEEEAGPGGFVGQSIEELSQDALAMTPASMRQGPLWEYARLLESQGLVLDTKGYATSFRVSARQQPASAMDTFHALQRHRIPCPPQVATRTNLGSIDFYPSKSGKKNCCEYLAEKLIGGTLADNAVCMGDDDNDIEMALACRLAFIPTMSSETMAQTISEFPEVFVVIRDADSTHATELALEQLLHMLDREDTTQERE